MKFCSHCLYLLTVLGLGGCGQQGPLYFPENPPPGIKVPVDEDQPEPIPERDIDQAPPRIDVTPPKPTQKKPNEEITPRENAQ
jgi:predicted small lipoprotein YifL